MIDQAALMRAIDAELRRKAYAAGAWLVDALSQEGSGVLYEGNPRRSSAIGEMPAPQSEQLLGSIDVRKDGNGWAVGSFSDRDAEGYAHAVELESKPPEQGGRPFLEMALADRDLHDLLRRA